MFYAMDTSHCITQFFALSSIWTFLSDFVLASKIVFVFSICKINPILFSVLSLSWILTSLVHLHQDANLEYQPEHITNEMYHFFSRSPTCLQYLKFYCFPLCWTSLYDPQNHTVHSCLHALIVWVNHGYFASPWGHSASSHVVPNPSDKSTFMQSTTILLGEDQCAVGLPSASLVDPMKQ